MVKNVSHKKISSNMLISFAIFDINEDFLHHDIEKSMGLFFDKILSNKHNAPSIINLVKQSMIFCSFSNR